MATTLLRQRDFNEMQAVPRRNSNLLRFRQLVSMSRIIRKRMPWWKQKTGLSGPDCGRFCAWRSGALALCFWACRLFARLCRLFPAAAV